MSRHEAGPGSPSGIESPSAPHKPPTEKMHHVTTLWEHAKLEEKRAELLDEESEAYLRNGHHICTDMPTEVERWSAFCHQASAYARIDRYQTAGEAYGNIEVELRKEIGKNDKGSREQIHDLRCQLTLSYAKAGELVSAERVKPRWGMESSDEYALYVMRAHLQRKNFAEAQKALSEGTVHGRWYMVKKKEFLTALFESGEVDRADMGVSVLFDDASLHDGAFAMTGMLKAKMGKDPTKDFKRAEEMLGIHGVAASEERIFLGSTFVEAGLPDEAKRIFDGVEKAFHANSTGLFRSYENDRAAYFVYEVLKLGAFEQAERVVERMTGERKVEALGWMAEEKHRQAVKALEDIKSLKAAHPATYNGPFHGRMLRKKGENPKG